MYFAGRTWRPKYESDSCILQLTSGRTYFPGTMLFDMASQGNFILAGEKERIQELQILIENLKYVHTCLLIPSQIFTQYQHICQRSGNL